MLSSKVDTLLMFQPPTREILQQKDIHLVAKRYFDLFSFTDSALVFLKRYLTENLTLVKHFDKTSTLLNQECHNFYSAWPKLHNDPSPLISILFFQLENIEALACSFPPLDYKSEEQVREGFLTKINNIKTVQQSLDKNFQTLWKQCQTQTSTYYQKLEEYKEQTDKVRRKYEKYEKQTRDFKSYNVTWVKKLEEKLAQRVATLKKSKEAYDQASNEAQESYKAILVFFESNKALIQEFLKLFLSTLVELSIFLVERIQESTGNMKQTTLEILQKIKKLDVKGSWDDEDAFIRKSSQEESQEVGYIKEMNRVNHHRQEFLSSVGGLSQEAMHLCQEFVEKSNFFEEISTFENFFTQFDDKITGTLLPFGDFLMSLKQIFVSFFVAEKTDSEQIIHKLALQRSNAYSSLVDALSKSLSASNMSSPQKRAGIQLDSPGLPNTKSPEVAKTAVSEFLQIEENLGKILIKDLERLYTAINTGIWNKILQVGQKCLMNFQDKLKDVNLSQEVNRIQANLVNEVDHIKEELDEAKNKIYNTEFVRTRSQMEEDLEMVADEKSHGAGLNGINKYNQHEFKFFKEKKAESLAGFVKKQNEEKLKEINPNPYTVDFEKSKTSVSARDDDSILGSFSCAFVENMLLQGRIYITTNKIVFKSYFNGRTLFGQTLLSIPLEDIVYVAKKKNALGLENMIEITTKKGELTFTSFVFRDKAFAMIDQVLTTLNPEYAKSPKGRRSVNADAIEGDFPLEDEIVGESAEAKRARRQQKKEMDWQRRNRAVIKAMPPLNKYDQLAHSHQYEIDYNTFAKTLFSPAPLEFQGKTYSCCWELIDERLGSYEITTTNWSQPVPKNFTRRRDLLPYKGGLERTTTGTRDLNMPVPLLPKNMTSKQTHRLFFVNESQSLMFLEMDTSQQKIPFSDAFKFYTCYIVTNESKEEGKPLVSVHLKYYVEWFYDTMFKKVISKATADEFTKSGPIFDTAIHDLMSAGIFEKRKQEYAAEDQAVETEEDDEDENEENNAGAEEQGLEGDGQEEAQGSTEQHVGTKAGKKEFKVSKRVVFLYFSVSLILLSYVFTMIVLK